MGLRTFALILASLLSTAFIDNPQRGYNITERMEAGKAGGLFPENPPNGDSLWMQNNYVKKEVYITMRDGVRLFTSIYSPKDRTEKHPVLMTRTPYSAVPYGEEFRPLWSNHYNAYLRGNYIIVVQDVRGRWMSEGKFENLRPYNPLKKTSADIDEASDTYDTIDWLVKNVDNNNGNVGVFGISYPGFYSVMAALSGHPALKAISPQAPVSDWFMGDDFHHNGAFFMMDAFAFLSGYDKPRPAPVPKMNTSVNYYTKDNYKFYLETGALKNFSAYTGDSIAFWKEMFNNPDLNEWWKKRTVKNFVKDIKPAVLVVGSPYDAEDAYGAWNIYQTLKTQSAGTNRRIVMGPWFHGQWARPDSMVSIGNIRFGKNISSWYANNIEIPFFDYYLKGTGKGPLTKEATIFFSGENNWRQFESWPPAHAKEVPYYLNTKGGLSPEKPVAPSGYTEYISDPQKPVPYREGVHFVRTLTYMTDDQRFAARRPDVIVFETEVLEKDITLAGPVTVNLTASTSGTDADFVVKVIDVFPDDFMYEPDAPSVHNRIPGSTYPMGGYQMLVRGDVMRGKYRKSFEKPIPFVPNSPSAVKFTMPDVAHTFKRGHRIMIQVQSSWFPLVDRNPQQFLNIYKCDDKDFKKATIRVFHNKTDFSYIGLPVLNE